MHTAHSPFRVWIAAATLVAFLYGAIVVAVSAWWPLSLGWSALLSVDVLCTFLVGLHLGLDLAQWLDERRERKERARHEDLRRQWGGGR